MIYILNTQIPNNKKILIALSFIFGLGKKKAGKICNYFGVIKIATINNINTLLKNQIVLYIEKNIKINSDLKQFLIKIKDHQRQLKTYKGSRVRFKLPCRGQRTHTNAKTSKKYN